MASSMGSELSPSPDLASRLRALPWRVIAIGWLSVVATAGSLVALSASAFVVGLTFAAVGSVLGVRIVWPVAQRGPSRRRMQAGQLASRTSHTLNRVSLGASRPRRPGELSSTDRSLLNRYLRREPIETSDVARLLSGSEQLVVSIIDRFGRQRERSLASAKVIVSYDGTANAADAIALSRIFAQAGAEVGLAYVRHTHEPDRDRETLVDHEAATLLEHGAALYGDPVVGRHLLVDRSTPDGLRALAERTDASMIVFSSDPRTPMGRVGISNSAERFLEGGTIAIAIAPAGLAADAAAASQLTAIRTIVVTGDLDSSAYATAETLAAVLGANIVPACDAPDLLIVDSRPEAKHGHIALSASATHLIEIAPCAVLVVPRGTPLLPRASNRQLSSAVVNDPLPTGPV